MEIGFFDIKSTSIGRNYGRLKSKIWTTRTELRKLDTCFLINLRWEFGAGGETGPVDIGVGGPKTGAMKKIKKWSPR